MARNRTGMDRVIIETNAFERQRVDSVLGAMLQCLYEIDCAVLKEISLPPIYHSGVRYKAEPIGKEIWQDAQRCVENRFGDCEDLACWRAAELTLKGIPAVPVFRMKKVNVAGKRIRLYHIMVQCRNGIIEDPSTRLGMDPPYNPRGHWTWKESVP